MGMCKSCGKVFSVIDMVDGVCKECLNPELVEAREAKQAKTVEAQEARQVKLDTLQNNKSEILNSILLTTETTLDLPIAQRIDLISSECVYGMNIIKDLFSFVRDIVGGRIVSIENALKEARAEIIADMKQQAYLMDGDAVIAVRIEHTYNNTNSGSILSVFATGTVVKLQKN